MTTVTELAPPDAELTEPAPVRPPAAPRISPGRARVCAASGLAAVLVLGFVAYLFGLSSLSESRFQNTSYKSFTRSLGQAVAPVGPTAVGKPVAVIDIPAIGLHHVVVVEGTDARRLTQGPGHRRDTPLPGQAGVSVIYGRRALFGAPFARLLSLNQGDRITVTTGQGVSTYVVSSFGNGAHPPPANSANRLVLVTADSAWQPHSTVSVSADLTGQPQPSAGVVPGIGPDERAMAGATGESLVALLLWSQALLLLAVVGTLGAHYWSPAPAYLCISPVVAAVVWSIYENAATLLPNVF